MEAYLQLAASQPSALAVLPYQRARKQRLADAVAAEQGVPSGSVASWRLLPASGGG